jgi:hypothetical protein
MSSTTISDATDTSARTQRCADVIGTFVAFVLTQTSGERIGGFRRNTHLYVPSGDRKLIADVGASQPLRYRAGR